MPRLARTRFVLLVSPFLFALALAGCSESTETAILDVDPRAGATQGAQSVRILGANFRADIGYTVFFGVRRASSVTIADPQTLLVTTPARDEPGPVDITIRADDGNAWKIAQGFRYENMAGSVIQGLGESQGPAKARF